MDGEWNKVKDWEIKNRMVIYKDNKGKILGEQDITDIIRSHVEGEVINDEVDAKWNTQ